MYRLWHRPKKFLGNIDRHVLKFKMRLEYFIYIQILFLVVDVIKMTVQMKRSFIEAFPSRYSKLRLEKLIKVLLLSKMFPFIARKYKTSEIIKKKKLLILP